MITSHYCFCHLKDPLGALCVAFELLRPGGILLFIEPLHVYSGSVPYSDHLKYHIICEAGETDAVRLHRDLLPIWVSDGACIFSSFQRRGVPLRHVLALRKRHATHQLHLPRTLKPGRSEVSNWDGSDLCRARRKDLEQPF